MAQVKNNDELLQALKKVFPKETIEKDEMDGNGFWFYTKSITRYNLKKLPKNVSCVMVASTKYIDNELYNMIACWFFIDNI